MIDLIGNRTLRDLLAERAESRPGHPSLVFETRAGTVEELTYAELLTATQTVAAQFQRLGLRKGDCVVILLPNTREFVVSWLGLAWLGAIAVPVNTANTAPEIAHVVGLSHAVGFVSTPEVVEQLRDDPRMGSIGAWVTARGGATPSRDVASWLAAPPVVPVELEAVGPDDVAELVMTSGTTSLPKAVMLTHGNYLYSGERESRSLFLDESDRLLTSLPMFHVNAQSNTLLAALTVGGTAILLESYSASRFWHQVRTHRATQLSLVAMQLRTLLAQSASPEDVDHNVRRVIYAINVSTPEKEAFEARFNLILCNGYGLSEAMTLVTAAPVFGPKRWPSIGLPAVGREIRIVDPAGVEVSAGRSGEIIVRGTPGRSLMKGYFDDPKATAEALRGEWLHTGDNGYIDEDGYVYFVDRSKDIIKRAGENVSSGEVERVLVQHAAVQEAAVIGVPDPIRDEAVKAFIVLVAGSSVSAEVLVEHCSKSLAAFKIPTEWSFIDALPKTSIGKVVKASLRSLPPPLQES